MHQTRNQDTDTKLLLNKFIKKRQAQMLTFLYNSQVQLALQKYDQNVPIFTELKLQQRKISIKTDQIKRIYLALSQKLHERIIRADVECEKLLNKLETLWESRKIDYFHRYYFEKYVYSTHLKNISTLIKNQDHLIRQQQHIYFSILRAIWARQACLNHIRRSLRTMAPEDMYNHFHTVEARQSEKNRITQKKQYKVYGFRAKLRLDQVQVNLGKTKMQSLSQELNNYRKLTYYLIELISSWKAYFLSLTHDLKLRRQKIEYFYLENNYYLVILNDANFISTSFLSNFYAFSPRNDPFFFKPILNLEKKLETAEQFSFKDQLLYQIINCNAQDLNCIFKGIQQLYSQFQRNVNHKKYFEKKNINQQLKIRNKAPKMNLNKLSPTKSLKLLSQKSDKLSKVGSSTLIKRQSSNNLPKLIAKTSTPCKSIFLSNLFENNTIYRSVQKNLNPQTNIFKMIEYQQIKSLKAEVINNVKLELEQQTKKLMKSKIFEQLIEEQAQASMRIILTQQQKRLSQSKLQITPLSFTPEQIKSYITLIYKQIPLAFYSMQQPQQHLSKQLVQIQYCYILKIHNKRHEVANVIATINRQIKQYKSIQIQLITFKFADLMEKIILKLTEFLWKYQSAKQIVFNFYSKNKESQQFLEDLEKKLKSNCCVITNIQKIHTHFKFIFTNKGVISNLIYNPFPEKIHFKLYSALCTQPLKLQSINDNNSKLNLHYDYIVLEMLRRFTNSEDFLILRSSFKEKDRYKFLINQLMEIENKNNEKNVLNIIQAESIQQLNDKLRHMRKPLLEVSDLITVNNVKLIQMEYTLTISYSLKVLETMKGQKYHRYTIHDNIQYMCDEIGTSFYTLPVQESQHLKILLFHPKSLSKIKSKGLNMYLYEAIQKNKWDSKFIQNMWIQMLRYPEDYTSRQQYMLNTYRCQQFDSISKELIIGDTFDWFTDIKLQNGIHFKIKEKDVVLTRPLGVGVITNKNIILYCRLFGLKELIE